ncbi:uncharacterized protein KD926_002915 [Aspergillus affinis]|uniref:uncharacterized protein n=1 Tax=Aspergillus affinis TaxID=1070780 RepID=UPI0022FE7A55|nr:uncharacterized protein KD926_002915 [Aspergillus affinis]KAI9035765.1 hypothetical protein KD926_002915 [Aspergillus affinis]
MVSPKNFAQPEPSLDGLPVELKILILFQMPDSDTLKPLVHASPAYHQAYLTVRHRVLGNVVERQYDESLDLVEALTAIRSKGMHFLYQEIANQDEKVIFLLDVWRRRKEIRRLSQSSSNPLIEPDSLEETIKLLHFHKMLCFLLEDFSINAGRPSWIQPAEWENEHLPLQLSPLEKRRFLRAMCRLQTLQNIFGNFVCCLNYKNCDTCPDDSKNWLWGRFNPENDAIDFYAVKKQAYDLFYGTMPLWEHEEMGNVFYYLISKTDEIAKDIADDLQQFSKNTSCEYFGDSFHQPNKSPLWYYYWDILPEKLPAGVCQINIGGLAALGPEFLYRILHMDRLSRRDLVCLNTRDSWPEPFIRIGLRVSSEFPFIDPADQLEAPNFEQFWSTLSPLEQPNVGWKNAWLQPQNQGYNLENSMNQYRSIGDGWK